VLDGSISLKFFVETRLKSKSFDPLIGFLEFLVQKLWPKNIKLVILPNFAKTLKILFSVYPGVCHQ